MGTQIAEARIRGILDSRACVTAEAEVVLVGGSRGRGSSAVAIAPGRHEQPRSEPLRLGLGGGSHGATELCRALQATSFVDEEDFDLTVERCAHDAGLGADVTLALSQAFWYAACSERGEALYRRLSTVAGATPAMPHPLVNIISGGIHTSDAPSSFQQIMAVPQATSIQANIAAGLAVFAHVQQRLEDRAVPCVLSASSGLLVDCGTTETLLCELRTAISETAAPGVTVGIGVDVAAEHLVETPGRYRLGDRVVDGCELLEFIASLTQRFDLAYVEDPFDPQDQALWRELATRLPASTLLVGDDLFATDAARLDRNLAAGVLLKPTQVGTITATVGTARAARAAGIELCVSHRSGETEDTFVCDLAVGLGARFQKIGGPRRGDRLAKYNQLLRLAEEDLASPGAFSLAHTS